MSAVEALKAARAAGVELALDGDDLALKAASAPPAAVLDALSRHKAEIMVLLRPAEDARRPGAVSDAAIVNTPTIRCCPTAPNPTATSGCIRVGGPPGTRPGKPRLCLR
jgi:hypothetical protein